ncbi:MULTISPECIES: hypothetical protein [unclassified Myroides]|uniref:hypothetical protein n=1 Tax=unclassified Myroides TaxID=2642485 RepID=UPI003D2F8525
MRYCFIIIALFFSLICQAQYQIAGQLKTTSEEAVSYRVVELHQGNRLIQRTFADEQGLLYLKI